MSKYLVVTRHNFKPHLNKHKILKINISHEYETDFVTNRPTSTLPILDNHT